MAKPVKTKFTLIKEFESGGRIGKIQFGEKGVIETPAFFPALCIMTGPPGFGRNGAHYKYIKRILCRDKEWRHTAFLTEILHFTDYINSKDALNRWLKKPFQIWMDEMMEGGDINSADHQGAPDDFDYNQVEKPYEACFFIDSGGFKLLSNMDFSIEKFGYSTSADSILHLQTKMGGDIIASLDYPLPPVEYDSKTLRELQNKSIRNAIALLRQLAVRRGRAPKPLAYLAVHGVDYNSSKEYTKRLLSRLDNEEINYHSFGFAIGSLVPRRSNRALVVSIVKGAKDAIQEHRNGYYSNKPVHAFGMSGDIIPILAFVGVDTFDSSSYVQFGKNINYILPYSKNKAIRSVRSLLEISERDLLNCGCRACKKYTQLLGPFKQLSSENAQKRHSIKGVDRKLIKSEIYAFLALHSLEIELREIEKIKIEISHNRLKHYAFEYAKRTNSQGALIKAYEAAIGIEVERPRSRKVSISLTQDSFSVPETYNPPKEKEILLLLPCTKDKPYKSSRSHEAIRSSIFKDSRIHIVTISGLYGPVPEEYEEEAEIMLYDYILTIQAHKQADFIIDRIVAYLNSYGNSYRQIFAYITAKAYRNVAKRALKKYGQGELLPKKLKERTSKEFLKRDNIEELQEAIRVYLDGRARPNKQLGNAFN